MRILTFCIITALIAYPAKSRSHEIHGSVLAIDSRVPVSGAIITLSQDSDTTVVHRTWTDTSGVFTFAEIDPGTYVLRLQPVGEPEAQCESPIGATGVKRCASAFRVTIVNDIAIVWPGILAFLFIIAFPIIALIRMVTSENKRWEESNVGR